MFEEDAKADASKIGFVLVTVGLIIFVLGTPLRLEWFAQNKYILNAPVAVLVALVAAGAVLMYLSSRSKQMSLLN